MYEKISDAPIREEKVRKLKAKICSEIDNISKHVRKEIKRLSVDASKEKSQEWNFFIAREYALMRLREYIDGIYTFQSIEAEYTNEDIVAYQVSDENLNIWLQEDYNFTSNFLYKIEYEGFCNLHELLNDRFFGYEFINIVDKANYEAKIAEDEQK